MKEFYISKNNENKRLDRVIREVFPALSLNALFKAFRKKDIKVNGIRVKENYITCLNDKVEVYIVDSILFGKENQGKYSKDPDFKVVYEDENLLIVDKSQGISVHEDENSTSGTLIDEVKEYLKEKGEVLSDSKFPALCHRLDRNTGGLVLIAKNQVSLDIILDKMKRNEIKKYYLCLVQGKMAKKSEELKGYLFKDARKSIVYINDSPVKGSAQIITKYRVISFENDISTLEVELVTGRTHQIRAHLAHIGHPIIGDGKYGINTVNRSLGAKMQQLWAYKLLFDFNDPCYLDYLNGKSFEVKPRFKI